jgi:anthranilate phosphoribosyltransferase
MPPGSRHIHSMIQAALQKVRSHVNLGRQEVAECFTAAWMDPDVDDACGDLFRALSEKGEVPEEIAGCVDALIAHAERIPLPADSLNICGTGGRGLPRFNVSTTAAFILGAGGVPVVKLASGSYHGNGSLDLLQALGCNPGMPLTALPSIWDKTSLCFLDVAACFHRISERLMSIMRRMPGLHQSILRYAVALSSPAQSAYQVVGVTRPAMGEKMVETCARLGRRHALVVYGQPGIDEISISGESQVFEYVNSRIHCWKVCPRDLDITEIPFHRLDAGDGNTNARLFTSVLERGVPKPLLDMTCVNAAAGFYCYGKADSLKEGCALALDLCAKGMVWRKFLEYKSACQT